MTRDIRAKALERIAALSAASSTTSFKGFIDYCETTSATNIPMDGYDYRCDPPRAVAQMRCESQGHRLSLTGESALVRCVLTVTRSGIGRPFRVSSRPLSGSTG